MTALNPAHALARGSPPGVSPPASRTLAPPTPEHAASVRRHPSPSRATDVVICIRCGFRAPDRADLPGEIAAIPARWRAVLSTASPAQLEAGARLRDELHAVANRIGRLRAAPGSAVRATLSIDAPTALSRTLNSEHLLAMFSSSAQRLADLTLSLDATEWNLRTRAGAGCISVAELALMPLHHSHARLTGKTLGTTDHGGSE